MSTVRTAGRRSAILPTLVIVAVLVVLFAIYTSVWTDRLWYRSFSFGKVFNTVLLTRVGLFASFGLIMAAAVAASAAVAYRLRPRFRTGPASSALLERYRELLESKFVVIVVVLAVLTGLFAGGAASGQIYTYLAWRNSTPFGVQDPQFHRDISFFVFRYPWWRFALSFLFTVLGFAIVVAAVVHYVMGGLRFSGARRGGTSGAQAQLSVLIGLAVVVKGISYWFDRYGQEIADHPLLTGINYTADHATVTAKTILAVIAGICAVLFFANAVLHRWVVPTIGLILMVLSGIVLGVVYPGAVQYFSVRPNEAVKERPYIANNIAATRAAYGVDQAEVTSYSAKTSATAGQLQSDAEALPGIRLIDPSVVGPAFEQLQQVRGYYSFPDTLDVDRYTINGAETDAVVGVREMNQQGVPAQNWNNLKTVYTHGYGLVAAYGNRRQSGGEPDWIAQGIPPTGELAEAEPRIYFGESLDQGYSIVGAPAGTPPVELDTPGGGENGAQQNFTYDGSGGVKVGSLWHRLLYAAKFADVNILLSSRVNDASKIIYDRTPRERVQKAAPWLTVDGDAYPAVVAGRIVWVVDGYTTSNSYPNSKRLGLKSVTSDSQTATPNGTVVAQADTEVNYMRNSVKAVVDAYDGTVKLYQWDTADPVLQTWEKAFPGVVQPKTSIPAELLAHLRYPQDLYKVQREILARYHVTDPELWYQTSAQWEVPNDPVKNSSTLKEPPFYLSVKWPKDPSAIFSLTSAYVPKGRANLAAYMAVNADAASPDYGRIRILTMSDTSQIDGPGQSFNAMQTNEAVATRLRSYNQQGSATATFGNLLTLPVGGGLLYVTPVYTQRPSGSGAYPALTFVVVRFGQSVGIGDTLQEALDSVFKGDSGASTGEGEDPTQTDPGTGTQTPNSAAATKALNEAQTAFAAAQKALTAGDLGTYQDRIKDAQDATARALKAMGR
ncbi:UPF0182 family protein [uncultured Friedmanniella sp.]|uniref:UPF0182 family membrane protein n=1 Tax=uncultured Friedmanniella sp. TaxID=335381 RepID=UPI0035CBAA22